jgi:transposase
MLGIDVSKDTLHCTLLDPASRQIKWSRTFPNTPVGHKKLLRLTEPECAWALEPTGSYSTQVVKVARAAGRDVRLAEPRRTKKFLQSQAPRAKCDRLDSVGLGLYALCCELPLYPLKSEKVEQLDQLLKARKGLGLALQQLQAQERALPHAKAALEPAIASLQAQQKHLDQEIKVLTQSASSPAFSCVQELQRVPGIGPVTAATLASRLVDRSFARSDAFVAYCGLDVTVRQSGHKHGNAGLSKHGDAELRRLLYLAAQSNLRSKNSPFKAHYDREKAKGLSSTAALCAVARKMARLCWSLVHHKQTYDPQRVYQQNPPAP